NKNWVLISKIPNIAATRVFILRVAKKEDWNVATDIRDSFDEDPMEAFFQKKLLKQVPISISKIGVLELCVSFVWEGIGDTFKSL
ncbi:43997_t:CDS:2, partial [Gigaspora margarita]